MAAAVVVSLPAALRPRSHAELVGTAVGLWAGLIQPAPSSQVPAARRSKLPYALGVVLVVVGIIGAIASGVGGFATGCQ